MRVLLIGSGGREHALAASMAASPLLTRLMVAPGNAGTAAFNVSLAVDDHTAVTDFCVSEAIDLVIIGPEVPLVAGLADVVRDAGIACLGPSAEAARLEGSKSFSRAFADRAGIPQPAHATFTDSTAALAWLDEVGVPVVVKADGLAAGKGVVIPESREETEQAIRSMLDDGAFGDASTSIVLEERMDGEELSLFGLTDGKTLVTLGTAQDHKRVGAGDTGPNTGGMGAFTPVPGIDDRAQAELADMFLRPVVEHMAAAGTPFNGVIFAGLMLTEAGPRLVEYNCRFGDPEAEVLLPMLDVDGLALMHAAATGTLEQATFAMRAGTAATVVVAADGYPANPRKGVPVELPESDSSTTVFHAGTRIDDGALVSSGGRVLAVTGVGADLASAVAASYSVVEQIIGDGLFARPDIGWRHLADGAPQHNPDSQQEPST